MIKTKIKWFNVRNSADFDRKIWGLKVGNWCLVMSHYDLTRYSVREWLLLQLD